MAVSKLPTPKPNNPKPIASGTDPTAQKKPNTVPINPAANTSTSTTSAVSIPKSTGTYASSAYQNVDQATYDAVKNIVQNKGLYNNSKYVNGSGSYGTYENTASQYYDQLRAAGRADIADGLQGSDYESAVNYLNSIGVPVPTTPTSSQSSDLMNTLNGVINKGSGSQIDTGQYVNDYSGLADTINNILGSNDYNVNGIYNDASGFINKGSNSAIDTGQYLSDADVLAKMFTEMTNGNANYNQSQELFGRNINELLDRYLNNDSATQGRIEDLWGEMSKYGAEQTGRYDSAADYLQNTNYLDTPSGQAIMQMYNQRGGDASRNAVADSTGGGSIDSYAAANANRQNLSFLNAGNEAALNQWNANYGNLLNTYGMLGNDMNNLQQNQIGLIGNEQNYNLGTQGNIISGMVANNEINANLQAGTADALANSLGSLAGMYNTQSNNASSDYAAGIGGYGNMYGNAVAGQSNDYATKANSLNNALNNLTSLNQTNSNNASTDYQNLLNTLGGAYGTASNNESQNYANDLLHSLGLAQNETTAQNNLLTHTSTMDKQQKEFDARALEAYLTHDLGLDDNVAKQIVAQYESEWRQNTASTEAGASNYAADKGYDSTTYKADKDYDSSVEIERIKGENAALQQMAGQSENFQYDTLYGMMEGLMNGEDETATGGRTVNADTAAEILLQDSRFKPFASLIKQIAKQITSEQNSSTNNSGNSGGTPIF